MVVRDVIAHFAVLVDDKPLTKMDKSLDRLKAKVKKFAMVTATAFTAAAYGAYKLVTAASDADEALNVLQATFKHNADAVLEWSRTVASAMGRSEYEFQDAAGKFGAFLTPIFKGSTQDIGAMSKQLSELAVDLASFYNTSDGEAVMRLFSGMSGETEAVRRYGIDISDAALDAFNKNVMGDSRTMRALSMAEKSVLRYRKILMDTTLAQGDAEKTAGSWANQVRRLQSRLKTIAVDMGRFLMPRAAKVLVYINKIVDYVADWRNVLLKVSSVFNTLLFMGYAYVAIWTVLNRQMLAGLAYMVKYAWQQGEMNKKLLASVGHAAKLAAYFLAIEDVFAFLSGQQSILGDVIKQITGTENPLGRVKRAAESIMVAFKNGYQYVVNAVELLLHMPKITHLLAQGKVEEATALRQGIMNTGIRDVDAERAQNAKDRRASFTGWVAKGGQEGLAGARQEGNRDFDESQSSAELRYLEERKRLLERGLKVRGDLRGKISAGTPIGMSNGQLVSATSEDIAQGFIPQQYLKGENLQQAMTMTQGNVTIGEVKVIVSGSDAKDPKALGERVKQGTEQAYRSRQK